MIFHKCKKHGSRICWTCFGTLVAFPVEHGIYKFVPGFNIIGHLFGM